MINQSNALQSTTQKYLELFDITNDVLVLRDGAVSMVLNSTAINFDLYSEEEQDAAIYAYAALLNSLSFPIEIVIRSQRKDVTSYLELLHQAELKAYNPVNKRNIKEYRQFVEELVQERNVLEKKFYIVITYTALEAGIISGATFIPGMSKKAPETLDKGAVLDKALTNLAPRRDHLIHQFARIGLSLRQLSTQELIQLFYTMYNPDSSDGMHVTNPSEYSSPLVAADIAPLPVLQAKFASETTVPLAVSAVSTPSQSSATEPIPAIAAPPAPQPTPVASIPAPEPVTTMPEPQQPPVAAMPETVTPTPAPELPVKEDTLVSLPQEFSELPSISLTPPQPPTLENVSIGNGSFTPTPMDSSTSIKEDTTTIQVNPTDSSTTLNQPTPDVPVLKDTV